MDEALLKAFKYWKTQEVEETFALQAVRQMPELDEWLRADLTLSDDEHRQLTYPRQRPRDKVQFWNEAALSFYFLGPLMSLVSFDTDRYSSFLEQSMTLPLNGHSIQGLVDFPGGDRKADPARRFLFCTSTNRNRPSAWTRSGNCSSAWWGRKSRITLSRKTCRCTVRM